MKIISTGTTGMVGEGVLNIELQVFMILFVFRLGPYENDFYVCCR
jgi:hypothetical protein